MSDKAEETSDTNYYDQLFARVTVGGLSVTDAVERVACAYLDGKPQTLSKRKPTEERHRWPSPRASRLRVDMNPRRPKRATSTTMEPHPPRRFVRRLAWRHKGRL